jgi:hypothetical protein
MISKFLNARRPLTVVHRGASRYNHINELIREPSSSQLNLRRHHVCLEEGNIIVRVVNSLSTYM